MWFAVGPTAALPVHQFLFTNVFLTRALHFPLTVPVGHPAVASQVVFFFFSSSSPKRVKLGRNQIRTLNAAGFTKCHPSEFFSARGTKGKSPTVDTGNYLQAKFEVKTLFFVLCLPPAVVSPTLTLRLCVCPRLCPSSPPPFIAQA